MYDVSSPRRDVVTEAMVSRFQSPIRALILCAVLVSKNVHSFVPRLFRLRYNGNELSSHQHHGATWNWKRVSLPQSQTSFSKRFAHECNEYSESSKNDAGRRSFIFAVPTVLLWPQPPAHATNLQYDSTKSSPENAPFHSAAYGREEYTNSIVASRDTNISPKEVYDTIASDYLKGAYDAAMKERGGDYKPRALDVGAGAGVSTEVLYRVGYRTIDALDWSGAAWNEYVVEDPSGYCPPSVTFWELDDERFLDKWRERSNGGNGMFDVIVFNFAVNESKAALFAKELLNKQHGRLLAPINTSNDYWLKQTYRVMDGKGDVLWSAADVGAWSVQFQPDVTQDTCSGIWCAPFNGFQKKR